MNKKALMSSEILAKAASDDRQLSKPELEVIAKDLESCLTNKDVRARSLLSALVQGGIEEYRSLIEKCLCQTKFPELASDALFVLCEEFQREKYFELIKTFISGVDYDKNECLRSTAFLLLDKFQCRKHDQKLLHILLRILVDINVPPDMRRGAGNILYDLVFEEIPFTQRDQDDLAKYLLVEVHRRLGLGPPEQKDIESVQNLISGKTKTRIAPNDIQKIRGAEDLFYEASWGELRPFEIEYIAEEILGKRSGEDKLALLISALGEADAKDQEEIVVYALNNYHHPLIVRAALEVLVLDWNLGEKYRDRIFNFMQGVEWDRDNEVKIAAIRAAGIFLRQWDNDAFLDYLLRAWKEDKEGTEVSESIVDALTFAMDRPEIRHRIREKLDTQELNRLLHKLFPEKSKGGLNDD